MIEGGEIAKKGLEASFNVYKRLYVKEFQYTSVLTEGELSSFPEKIGPECLARLWEEFKMMKENPAMYEIIHVHFHPSGLVFPSKGDLKVTSEVRKNASLKSASIKPIRVIAQVLEKLNLISLLLFQEKTEISPNEDEIARIVSAQSLNEAAKEAAVKFKNSQSSNLLDFFFTVFGLPFNPVEYLERIGFYNSDLLIYSCKEKKFLHEELILRGLEKFTF